MMRIRLHKPVTDEMKDGKRPIALLAGWGHYPEAVALSLRKQGRRIVGIGIIDHADPQLARHCDEFDWMGIGGIGRAIRLCKRWGARQAIMAGKVHKVMYYQPRWWLRHRPDWKCIKAFYPQLLGYADRKDDTLLSTLVNAFAAEGIAFQSVADFAPELLVQAGHLAGKPLSAKQQKDVEFGWQVAKAIGGLDIGQTVCIKDQTVIAVEAIEGTDLCIRRAGELCTAGGMTVIKVAKPRQDMRFDVPTVGMKTLESIAAASGRVLAIEAGKTILLDQAEFVAAAQRLSLTVVAVEDRAAAQIAA
jgi:UDP-2,3-diacylglucosamine hydrolase